MTYPTHMIFIGGKNRPFYSGPHAIEVFNDLTGNICDISSKYSEVILKVTNGGEIISDQFILLIFISLGMGAQFSGNGRSYTLDEIRQWILSNPEFLHSILKEGY